jgi:hypothetical protein
MDYRIDKITIKELLDDRKYLTNIDMQREYIYSDVPQAQYLLDSIQRKIPTPAIYLWENNDGTYEVLDGKQRITVMRLYRNPNYLLGSIHNLILLVDYMTESDFENYEIPVIICNGEEEDKIETFKRINTTAMPLKEFEILSALYQGCFSKEFGDWGISLSKKEEKFFGKSIRGDNCIKALGLFTLNIEEYFRLNRNKSFVGGLKKQIDDLVVSTVSVFNDYNEDWYILAKIVLENYQKVDLWKENKNKIVKLFNLHKNNGDIELAGGSKEDFYKEMLECYATTGLDSRRFFSIDIKQKLFNSLQSGRNGMKICPKDVDNANGIKYGCGKEFAFKNFKVDHITAWCKGGKTTIENAQLLCDTCNKMKGTR